MREDWTEKYRPRTLSNVVGNKKALGALRRWAAAWEEGRPKKRAAILHGEPGIGKTTSALALANDMGWGVIEMNASDSRNADVINRVAGVGASNETFSDAGDFVSTKRGGRKLIVMDEADNIFGREDRGGISALVNIISETNQPIILIANDHYGLTKRSSKLKSRCQSIPFKTIKKGEIKKHVKRICTKEKLEITADALSKLVENASGDLRCAVNDLQSIARGRDRRTITLQDLNALGVRDSKVGIFDAVRKVLQSDSLALARSTLRDLDETPEQVVLWVDENLPHEYKAARDLERGFNYLSRADVFLGRVHLRREYRFWAYASDLMGGGVAVAKQRRYRGWTRYKFPTYLRKMGRSKGARMKRHSVMTKIGSLCHMSTNAVKNDMYQRFKQLFDEDEEFALEMIHQLRFEPSEVAYILDTRKNARKVTKLMEAAEELRDRRVAKLSMMSAGGNGASGTLGAGAWAGSGTGEGAAGSSGEDTVMKDAEESAPAVEDEEKGPEEPEQEDKEQRTLFDF